MTHRQDPSSAPLLGLAAIVFFGIVASKFPLLLLLPAIAALLLIGNLTQ